MADNKELAALVAEVREIAETLADPMEGNRITRSAGRRLQQIAAVLTATPSAQAGEVEPFGHYFRDVEGMDRFHRGPRAPGFAQSDITPLYTTPQPQGDASPQVSGGGERMSPYMAKRWLNELLEECDSTLHEHAYNEILSALSTPRTDEPAPTVDGGAVAWVPAAMLDPRVMENFYTASRFQVARDSVPLYTHPAPAPDVARLVEAAEAFPEEPNPYTYRIARAKLREALAPFTQEGATNGQE